MLDLNQGAESTAWLDGMEQGLREVLGFPAPSLSLAPTQGKLVSN